MEKPPPRPQATPTRRRTSDANAQLEAHTAPAPADPLISGPTGATTLAGAASGVRAWLELERGGTSNEKVAIGAGTVVIGRSSKCEVPLRGSEGVSRRHCKVQFLDGQYWVIDLESRNGTRVNGAHIERRALASGDLIEVGDERIRFTMTVAPGVTRAPVGAAALDLQPTALMPAEHDDRAPTLGEPPMAPSPRTGAPQRRPAPPNQNGRAPEGEDGPTKAMPSPPRGSGATERVPRAGSSLDAGDAPDAIQASQPRHGLTTLLVAAATVCVLTAGVAAWDVFFGSQRLVALFAESPLTQDQSSDAREHKKGGEDPGAASPTASEPPSLPPASDGPVRAQAQDRSAAAAPTSPATPPRPRAADPSDQPAADVDAVVVQTPVGGRVASVRVRPGQRVARGDVVATLEAPGGNRKKLEARRAEEREFVEAVESGNKAAERDLEAVRREIAELESRLQDNPVRSDSEGTVLEVLVRAGASLKPGEAVIRLQP